MTDNRSIAFDVTFTILYIGYLAAMASLSLVLIVFAALDIDLGPLQGHATALNLLGWAALPLAPLLYRRLVGHPFSWRTNSALGSSIDA
ncbi:MAG: hypothetical protein K2Y42_07990 [Hyphomicrobium sp.]|jgi:hypothetical protein|uniref:hypothetical protein n=1 Tax=Hyphomicrobium sp. TaxID=82 RepID=UPI0025C131BB|nr:hypothetical protein [Hyphomicrobium sp.]MBX9862680.1 hypothetical protein [Hyphomicrobium sp.]